MKQEQNQNPPEVTPHSINGLDILTLRVSKDGKVQYANTPFYKIFSIEKPDIINQPISNLSKVLGPALTSQLKTLNSFKTKTQDEQGRSWEIKCHQGTEHVDIVLQDISDFQKFENYVRRYISSDLADLDPQDLETFKYPERRNMTVSFCDLRGFTQMSESLSPEELRTTMNAFLEEVINAIDRNGATVDKIIGDEVMALFGAPRYYKDHALRAIKTACEQTYNLRALQKSFFRVGKHIPSCGIGISTGEMIVGNVGGSTRQDYTVIGRPVNVASRLCSAANEEQIICSEVTMKKALQQIPDNWEIITTTETKTEKTQPRQAKEENIFPLPEDLIHKSISIGPGIGQHPEKVQFKFHYLYAMKVKGLEEIMPIVSVFSPQDHVALNLKDHEILKNEHGKHFGKYSLLKVIGRGGMGEVWKAKDAFDHLCAIKLLLNNANTNLQLIERFKREAEIMGKLRHRHLCHIYDVGQIDGMDYIAIELIDGISLSKALEVKKGTSKIKYSTNQSLKMMISIAEAVEHAHEHQIFHRDLKPANIMLRKNMDPVVMDFGLAKMNYGQESNEMSLSMSGQIIGTIEYMAPEQAKSSKTVDQRADIYSLGAILYQMLTGEKHFKSSGNILTDAIGLERHTPRRPKEWNPMISADLETITMKALRPDPNDRYQTIQSFLQDLQAVSNGSRIEARDLFLTELLWRWAKNNKTISSLSVLFIFLLTLSLIIFVVNLNAEKTKAQKALSYLKQEQLARENLSHEAAPRFLLEARAHLQANDFEKANISLNIASNLNRDLAEAKWLQACFHIIHKRFQEATSILKNIHKHKNSEKLHSLSRQLSIDSANDQLWAQVQDILIKENEFRLAERINSDREKLFEIWKLRIEQEYQAELKESRGLLSLSLSQIQSLNAIKGIPIEDLTIANSPALSDISSLSGLPLIKLTLKDTNVSDLSAISTAPLKELILLRCKVEKLTASISWNLSHLIINDCPIQSLDSFKDQPLFFLELGNISMENLEFISKMQLNHLIVNNLPIHDLSPITNLPLEHLRLEEIPANDISSLSSLTLKSLMLKQMKISSLEPLKNMKLESLNLEHSQFDHLSVIKHMKLQDIDLDHTNVKDIAFLKDMPIVTIDLENTNIDNIDVLRGMELKSLDLDRLPIKNIDLVKGMPLEALDIERTLVDNLEPLRGLPLKHLDMGDCDATDLEPLNNMPLEELYLHRHYLNDGNRKFKNLQVIKSLKNLKLLSINMKSLSQEDQEMLRSIPGLKIIF